MTAEAAREALTEKMVAVGFEHGFSGQMRGSTALEYRCTCGEWVRSRGQHVAETHLAAVLSARLVDDCPTCEGTGTVWDEHAINGRHEHAPEWVGCSDCEGSGKRYGPLLITVATMEEVGVTVDVDDEILTVRLHDDALVYALVPVFVESPGEEQ